MNLRLTIAALAFAVIGWSHLTLRADALRASPLGDALLVDEINQIYERRPAQNAAVEPESIYDNDRALACHFAPILLNQTNEQHPRGGAYDLPIHMLYDVAQTATHVFISYNIIKGWSEFPITKNFSNEPHFMDTEDVFLVIKKNSVEAKPFFFSTNAHGQRIEYFLKDAPVDIDELAAAQQRRSILEGRDPNSSRSQFEGMRNTAFPSGFKKDALDTDITLFDNHPVLISRALDHALTDAPAYLASSRLPDEWKKTFADCESESGLASKLGTATKVPLFAAVPVLLEMKYEKKTTQMSTPQSLKACSPHKVMIHGNQFELRDLPSVIDSAWYLETYLPNILTDFRKQFSQTNFEKYLYADPKTIFYSQDALPSDNCSRLDPAKHFSKVYPKTFALQKGALEYSRYEGFELFAERAFSAAQLKKDAE